MYIFENETQGNADKKAPVKDVKKVNPKNQNPIF